MPYVDAIKKSVVAFFRQLFPLAKIKQCLLPGEVIPGVTKPSRVLAELIALEIRREMPKIEWLMCDNKLLSHFATSYMGRLTTTRATIMLSRDSGFEERIYSVMGVDCLFDEEEKKLMLKAIKEANDLRREQERIDSARKNQEKALADIEKWMGVEAPTEKED